MIRQIVRRGFTLIEVLVAVAIIAVTLAAGLRAAASLTQNAARLVSVTDAQWCADNQITNMKLARIFPDVGTADQACLQRGIRYQIRTTVRASFNPNFRIVEAAVSDESGVQQARLTAILSRF